jgi:hypothetical protein
MNTFQPDLFQAHQYLDGLHPNCASTFQTFGDKAKDLELNRVFHGTLDEHADALFRLNRAGAGIFVMVNEGDGFVHDGRRTCRTNQNVVLIRSVFCDLDGAPLEPILKAALAPHIIVESSPGKWHAYWLTSDTTLNEFKGVQQALAAKYNGDPSVCDLARVMRLPGFYHQKGEPFMTRLVKPAPVASA